MKFDHAAHFPDTSASARTIVPLLLSVTGHVRSAIDVGGGRGAWVAALKAAGVASVRCIDDFRVEAGQLLVAPEEFIGCDLRKGFPEPVSVDLALCLEVAEHLPASQSHALVRFLTDSAGVVLFSSAIPGQPSPFHINEQPAEYWRQLFLQRGYQRFDCIRPLIIEDGKIPYWYRQNLFVYATASVASARRIADLPFERIPHDFELVSTRVLGQYRAPREGIRRKLLRNLRRAVAALSPGVVKRALNGKLHG